MTWNETHERTRIFREVEAFAAADLTGAVPWRDAWAAYFDGPDGLVAALRARWNRTVQAQFDPRVGDEENRATLARLRRSVPGLLTILECQPASEPMRVRPLTEPQPVAKLPRRRRFHGGPILPTTRIAS